MSTCTWAPRDENRLFKMKLEPFQQFPFQRGKGVYTDPALGARGGGGGGGGMAFLCNCI